VILRDVRLGNGYRVVEIRNVLSENAGYGQGGSITFFLVELGMILYLIQFRIRQSCLDEHTLGTGIITMF